MDSLQKNVTQLLSAVSTGDQSAKKKLFSIVYQELHALAHKSRRYESPGCALQTTDLVHETYMRLVKDDRLRLENRAHFFGIAARAMRRILVEEFRKKKTAKRGNGIVPVSLCEVNEQEQMLHIDEFRFEDLEAMDQALDKLGTYEKHRRKCTIVELRFFVGLSLEETAEALDISRTTVKRDWDFTRAWLHQEIQEAENDAG